jgi:histone H3/H4
MQIIVKTKVKEYVDEIAGERMSVSTDLADALNNKVLAMIQESIKRAKANGRRTVMAKDV